MHATKDLTAHFPFQIVTILRHRPLLLLFLRLLLVHRLPRGQLRLQMLVTLEDEGEETLVGAVESGKTRRSLSIPRIEGLSLCPNS